MSSVLVQLGLFHRKNFLHLPPAFQIFLISLESMLMPTSVQRLDTGIPQARQYGSRSCVTFEADKASSIHFTRQAVLDGPPNVRFGDLEYQPGEGQVG
jgi:hypothetical protein